ncbi:thioredoxin [bacterium]|nr:thioredoxin [bacterium]
MHILGQGKPAKPAAGAASAHIKDGTDRTFVQDVIQPSREQPVIVDFWAPWCGPCKALGPVLEKAVDAAGGAVKLVKINIDENPAIAGQLGVRSIPAVVAFKDGRPADAFMGAVPESDVKAFIAKLGGPAAGPSTAELLAEAENALDADDIGAAAEIYAMILQQEQDNIEALSGLAHCYLKGGDQVRAQSLIDMIPPANRSHPSAASVISALALAARPAEPDEVRALMSKLAANPGDHATRFDLAEALSALSRHDEAAEHLLTILEADLGWNEGAARAQLLKIFEAAGPKAEVSKSARRRLSALLFR